MTECIIDKAKFSIRTKFDAILQIRIDSNVKNILAIRPDCFMPEISEIWQSGNIYEKFLLSVIALIDLELLTIQNINGWKEQSGFAMPLGFRTRFY